MKALCAAGLASDIEVIEDYPLITAPTIAANIAGCAVTGKLPEGAYARAGLASDIEVIEDYPSHYSAYNRRKHRWLRGDWQIAEWLLPRVPDESGQRVVNPISITAQWKIFDNLRRSLVEPAILVLLVLGWVALPGSPLLWTLATVAILFAPTWCEFMLRVNPRRDPRQIGNRSRRLGHAGSSRY